MKTATLLVAAVSRGMAWAHPAPDPLLLGQIEAMADAQQRWGRDAIHERARSLDDVRRRNDTGRRLIEAITLAERAGGTALSAKAERWSGKILVHLETGEENEHGTKFVEVTVQEGGGRDWKPQSRACVAPLEVSRYRSERAALRRSELCLAEAITLAECLTGGDVLAIVPKRRGGRVLFLAEVASPTGGAFTALIDAITCDFQ